MRSCKAVKFWFRISPSALGRWSLLARHAQRCSDCVKEAADIAEAVSVTIPHPAPGETPDFWPAFAGRLDRERRARGAHPRLVRRWTVAAAGLLASAAVLVIILVPKRGLPGPEMKLQVESVRINDAPGRAIIFQGRDPDKTFVWIEKQ